MIEVDGAKQDDVVAVLADRVREACAGSTDDIPAAMRRALAELLDGGITLPPEQCRGMAEGYTRHLLHADAAGCFSVVAIVWRAGQFSPVHGHHIWCAYAVVSGTLQEERYQWSAEARGVRLAERYPRKAGDISFSYAGVEEAHRLGNPGGEDAVSIHVYGIDSQRVNTHVNRVVKAVQ